MRMNSKESVPGVQPNQRPRLSLEQKIKAMVRRYRAAEARHRKQEVVPSKRHCARGRGSGFRRAARLVGGAPMETLRVGGPGLPRKYVGALDHFGCRVHCERGAPESLREGASSAGCVCPNSGCLSASLVGRLQDRRDATMPPP